jgi:hypothetical protein
LLHEQRQNLVDFSHAFARLSALLDVLDPDAVREMTLFLSSKVNIIKTLTRMLDGDNDGEYLIFGSNTEAHLLKLVQKARDSKLHYSFGTQMELLGELRKAFDGEETIRIGGGIRIEKVALVSRYLEERRPREQLEKLEVMLAQLHKVITANFKIDDILLSVGDRRALKKHYAPMWDPNNRDEFLLDT